MTWFKVDDGFWSHPKVCGLSAEAVSLWVRAGSYAAQHLTDGYVGRQALPMLAAAEKHAEELVTAGLWGAIDDAGWVFHDWHQYQPTRTAVMQRRGRDARRQALYRDTWLVSEVKRRDGGRCRYCGVEVDWADRRSARGGTLDHIDPNGENRVDNVVTACRGCNSRKRDRTPDDAGMVLLDVSSDVLARRSSDTSGPDPTRPGPSHTSGSRYKSRTSRGVTRSDEPPTPVPPPASQVIADLGLRRAQP